MARCGQVAPTRWHKNAHLNVLYLFFLASVLKSLIAIELIRSMRILDSVDSLVQFNALQCSAVQPKSIRGAGSALLSTTN